MLVYVRIQCKNEFYVASDYTSAPREVLFEIRGRPHFLPDTDEFRCFFAMAQPYPSRNTAMYVPSSESRSRTSSVPKLIAHERLTTFLELKMENERLQQRVKQLRTESQTIEGPHDSPFTMPENFGSPDAARTSFNPNAVPEMEEDGTRKKVCMFSHGAETFHSWTCSRPSG